MACYIGIDIGTSSAKLILIDSKGNVCARQDVFYNLTQTLSGWFEIDPCSWYDAVMHGASKLLEGTDRSMVGGIGFTGQMHTTVFVDARGHSIRPAISWNDTRTSSLLGPLREEISRHYELRHIGGIISNGSPAANLYWLSKNEPENFAKIHKMLIGPDYLTYRFTGVYATDYCKASTSSLYDIYHKQWSERMCNILSVPMSVLPPVYSSGHKIGLIQPEIAAQLGIEPTVQIIMGTGDNPSTYLSSAMLKSGEPIISLGTSGVLMYARDAVDEKAKGKTTLFSAGGDNFSFIVQGTVQSSGSCYSWWAKNFLDADTFEDIQNKVDITKPVNQQLLFYPHLNGDKTIYADPYLKGALIGIGTNVNKEEVTRAILEGISFAFKQLMEEMYTEKKPGTIKVAGKMSCVQPFMQILADVLQIQIETHENISAVQGIAILTAQSCEDHEIEKIAQGPVTIFNPRKVFSEMYTEKYQKYKKIYSSIKEIYN